MSTHRLFLPLFLVTASLVAVSLFGIRQYQWNVSGLLHMDDVFGATNHVPHGLVLYKDGGYDGMSYYQVTRDLPALFSGENLSNDSPYRFQRILLPLFTYALSFGHENQFPLVMLLINIVSAVASLALVLMYTKRLSIHAFAIVFNPAVLVGILYSLTEPLSLFFTVAFYFAWEKNNRRLGFLAVTMLTLALFARETTIFLIVLLVLWNLWKRQWKDLLFLSIPVVILLLWQYSLAHRLGSVPFQTSSGFIVFPFTGAWSLVVRLSEHINSYLISGLAVLLFASALLVNLSREWIQKRTAIDALCFLLTGLTLTLFSMHDHMWGAITSIGRVVTPLYPTYVLYAAERNTWIEKSLSWFLVSFSIAAAAHPYVIS